MMVEASDAAIYRTKGKATDNASLPAMLLAGFVLGIAILPMLPFWGDALRLVAVLAVAVLISAGPWRRWVLLAVLTLLLVSPLMERHMMALSGLPAYLNTYISFHAGYPLRITSALALFAASGGIIVALWLIVRQQTTQRPVRFAAGILLALAGWVALNTSFASVSAHLGGFGNLSRASIPLIVAVASSWLVWIIGGLLVLVCVRNGSDQKYMLSALGTAALILAGVVFLQYAARDFSYVLEFPDLDYMYRVRGTYYYHGAASLFLAIGLFSLIGSASMRPSLRALAVLAVGLALYLNSTRALSIAFCAGALVAILVLAPAWRRRLAEIAVLAVLLPLFATSVLYTKDEQRALPDETTRVEALAQTNQSRFALGEASLARIAEQPVSGVGPGCQVPLSGYVLGGELCTDSSHILVLDLALAQGAPAAFLFLLLAAGAATLRLLRAIRNRDGNLVDAGLLGFCAMYAIASLFFPQERDWTVLVVFMLLALAFVGESGERHAPLAIEKYPPLQRARGRGLIEKFVIGACVLGALGWSVVTSATYSLPLYDVVRAEREALRGYGGVMTVHTNNPVLAKIGPPILATLFRESADFELIVDDAEQLPLSGSGWVLWSASYDDRYPNLRSQRGFDFHRGYGVYPAFVAPTEWIWHGSSAPSTALAALEWQHVGFSAFDIPGTYLECPTSPENSRITIPPYRSCSILIETSKSSGRLADSILALDYSLELVPEVVSRRSVLGLSPRLRGSAEATGSLDLRLPVTGRRLQRSSRFEGSRGGGSVEVPFGGVVERMELFALAGQSPALLTPTISIRLGGNLARPTNTYQLEPNGALAPVPEVVDGRTSTLWVGRDGDRIVVDAGEGTSPLIAYELVAPHQPDAPAAPVAWSLDGSNDLERWTLLETKAGASETSTRRLLAPQTDAYRYYRFTFQASAPNEPLGLTGLLLFPFAPPISLHFEQKAAE